VAFDASSLNVEFVTESSDDGAVIIFRHTGTSINLSALRRLVPPGIKVNAKRCLRSWKPSRCLEPYVLVARPIGQFLVWLSGVENRSTFLSHLELEQRREKVDGIVDRLTSFVQFEGRAQDRGSGL
jgi:hypothetical protein